MARVPGILIASSAIFLVISIVGILALGRDIVGPLAGALVIWFIINALGRAISWLRRAGVVARVDTFLSILVFLAASVGITLLFLSNADGLRGMTSVYNDNLSRTLVDAWETLGIPAKPDFSGLVSSMNPNEVVLTALGSAANTFASLIMVVLYLTFLFTEQASFSNKLSALVENRDHRAELHSKLSGLRASLEKYIGIKCLEGLILGVGTFFALKLYGVDFAPLWAFSVLLISFVPTIGTIVGTALPVMVALMQFGAWKPALELAVILGALQVVVNNFLEPRLLGKSFNLSPVAILIVLAAGFEIWGVLGAILAIPILVIAVTICANFNATRPIAIILSGGADID